MSVTAIIPNWNARALLEPLLASIASQTRRFDDVLMVDNGSTDGSPEAAERGGARVLRLDRNYGFAYAVNRGIEVASTRLVALINNDVELHRAWLETLVEAMTSTAAWFASGKVLCAAQPGLIDGAFDLLATSGCAWRAGSGRPDAPVWNEGRKLGLAPMTAALFHRELFDRVGNLDENFGSYLEDVDFGLRCGSKGYSGIYVPAAVAYHRGSATLGRWSPRKVRQIARNQVLLVAKHYAPRLRRECGWAIALGQCLWGLVALRHGHPGAWLAGKLEGLRDCRRYEEAPDGAVRNLIRESERELLDLQRRCGFDLYWRVYFALKQA
ncbi:MAG TPA: glycosyltransferase family 2 protein [Bryobacteraceae bacterium]|nr:glycosyltransferase family 2 protein [Bryobacteraceae bacterium]